MELVTNVILGNLACFGNAPRPAALACAVLS